MQCLKRNKPTEDNTVYLYIFKTETEGNPKKAAKIAGLNKGLSLAQEVRRGIGALLLASRQVSQPGELVNGGVLEQPLPVGAASARHDLDVDLDTLARAGHLLVGLGLIGLLRRIRQSARAFQHAVQAFGTARIPSLPQPAPQVNQAQRGVSSPQIPISFSSASVCWFGCDSGRLERSASDSSVPSYRDSQKQTVERGRLYFRDARATPNFLA